MSALPRYVLLAGGVGGAKLALGLARTLQPGQLTIIANTGDDFSHLGLGIAPDLDTLMYTLAGVVNETTGWGLRDETWSCMAGLEALGAETWFRLGDRDLATHLERTRLLAAGHCLTEVTQQLCSRLGVSTRLLPMSDLPVRTVLDCDTAAGPATLANVWAWIAVILAVFLGLMNSLVRPLYRVKSKPVLAASRVVGDGWTLVVRGPGATGV